MKDLEIKKISLNELQSRIETQEMLRSNKDQIQMTFKENCKTAGISDQTQTLAMMFNFNLFFEKNIKDYNEVKGGD